MLHALEWQNLMVSKSTDNGNPRHWLITKVKNLIAQLQYTKVAYRTKAILLVKNMEQNSRFSIQK